MRRFIVALLILVSLTACNWSLTRFNYGPYEVKYLYGGVDTIEAHYVERWGGYVEFRDHLRSGGNVTVMRINGDAVLSYRSLNPHGNKVGK